MLVLAGIDEAGYGPLFGPLVIGRSVVAVDQPRPADWPSGRLDVWKMLRSAVCLDRTCRRGRIAVNDSKKLHQSGAEQKRLRHLERGCLAFAALAGSRPAHLGQWLDFLGEDTHRDLTGLPWYEPVEANPWGALPMDCSAGEIAIDANLLSTAARQAGVAAVDLGAAVVFEDRFNRMVAATRSKASASFTFVAKHLTHIWNRFGEHHPLVVVDRQSGRTHYRELLAMIFPGDKVHLRVLEESPNRSAYHLQQISPGSFSIPGSHQASVAIPCGAPPGSNAASGHAPGHDGINEPRASASGESASAPLRSRLVNPKQEPPSRAMTVSFEVDGESASLPTALASMISKYTRELLMARFQAYFSARVPDVKPTAGYGADAKRFWQEIEPRLADLAIVGDCLRRIS
ncbi:MAG: hypothetical protein IT443_02325 [Phycisphaeraceae bacterium]|nr:hypothetical protein [Phycisphaeraceae bacterium]